MPSVEEFMDRLVHSGLMSMRDVAEFHRGMPAERRSDTELFAKELVKSRKLTKFQASAVYQGKTQGLVFGDYFVLDKIGVGGMGKVFKARHRQTGQVFALKVMSSQAMKSAKAIRRFQQETEVAKRLRHPNIVATYSSGELDGLHYLIMQYIDGENLRNEAKSRVKMPVSEVVSAMIQTARGLEYAHGQGAVHRDIKPSNLLLDKTGTVMILDMGLARIEDPDDEDDAGRLTQAGQMLGTAEYMSPEQVEDPRHANAASDVYSLGCTMFYLLTGTPPFRGSFVAETLIMHATTPIPSLKARRPDVPDALEAVFRRMMAKKPGDRFQTMTEVIEVLEAIGSGNPIQRGMSSSGISGSGILATDSRNPSSDPYISAPSETESPTQAANRDMSLERNVSLPGIPSIVESPTPLPFTPAPSVPHDQTLELIHRQRQMVWMLAGLAATVGILLILVVVLLLNR